MQTSIPDGPLKGAALSSQNLVKSVPLQPSWFPFSLLKALSEIRIGIKAVQSEQLDQEHPLDRSYRGLSCEIRPLEKDNPDFQVCLGEGERRGERGLEWACS